MSMFGWCSAGQHDTCRREAKRFTLDPKKNTIIWSDEVSVCECTKRGCKCFVPAKNRGKTTKRKRKT